MFTGIIQAVGSIEQISGNDTDKTLTINASGLDLTNTEIGDSIAIDGVCLTVTAVKDRLFSADVSHETLTCTTLKRLEKGSLVNLEKAMTPATPFGGHIVTGHVDAVGNLLDKSEDGACYRYVFDMPEQIAKYLATKGSVTINGVSLTLNGVNDATAENRANFHVLLIPHTENVTNLGKLTVGDDVNLEVDLIARYVERMLTANVPEKGIKTGLALDDIRRFGL